MSKFPSSGEFEESLNAIRIRDKGTPELIDEARNLEPSDASVRAFLTKKAELIQSKQQAVKKSPVPIWLESQPNYQRALNRIFKHMRRPMLFPEWLDVNTQKYLQQFSIDSMLFLEESGLSVQYEDPTSEANRLQHFRNFVVNRLYSDDVHWDFRFISSLYRYIQKTAQPNIESRTRSNKDHQDELEAIELLLQACDDTENKYFSFDARDYSPMLNQLRDNLIFEKSLSERQSRFIKASDDTVLERELILDLWLWFETNSIPVSGRSLHELLSIDGIERALPDLRSIQRNIAEWRRLHRGDTD